MGLCALLYCFSPRWVSLNDPKSSTGLDGSDTRCLSELLCCGAREEKDRMVALLTLPLLVSG